MTHYYHFQVNPRIGRPLTRFNWRAGMVSLLLGQALLWTGGAIAQTTPEGAAELESVAEESTESDSLAGASTETTAESEESFSYSQLINDIKAGNVEKFILDPQTNEAQVFRSGQAEEEAETIQLLNNNDELLAVLQENNVEWDVIPSRDYSLLIGFGTNILFLLLLLGVFVYIMRRSTNAQNNAMSFGRSQARFQLDAETGIMFKDVAGIDEAKEELAEVVTFLREPNKFTALGAKIPRGLLLVGPPGTGKTLLAKAIAGEAGVPIFSIAGSEFVEMFVGVGASRVRDLFRKAKENAPCLVFIDEIDAVGRQRGAGIGGGNDEREQTLNQLLTEMDGFEENSGIIVIAATNRADVLDRALLRPGRFDRQITVDYPDYQGRLAILEVHARDKRISDEVDFTIIARRTPGFSGADLANLLNEAAIFTARFRKDAVTMAEINLAIDRVIAGMEGLPLTDNKTKRLIAYHEVGHALIATLNPHHDPVEKVTLIPRGISGGSTWYLPDEEMGLETRLKLLAKIDTIIAGRAAEAVIFGEEEVTDGAVSDIQKITALARAMVTRYGMSDIGQFALETTQDSPYGQNHGIGSEYSEQVASAIDSEIRHIILRAYERTKQVVQQHRQLIDYLVDLLIELETIDGEKFRAVVNDYQGPKESPVINSLVAG